jgi:hypothetical protein
MVAWMDDLTADRRPLTVVQDQRPKKKTKEKA